MYVLLCCFQQQRMNQSATWVRSFLTMLQKQPEYMRSLFDELVYGKNDLCMLNRKQFTPITVFLNESVPEILVLLLGNTQLNFDLKHCNLLPYSYTHQFRHKLPLETYVVLVQQTQEAVLIFPHHKQRQQFLDLMKFYKQQLRSAPIQVDSTLLSLFLAIDTNRNMVLDNNEFEKLLRKIKLRPNQRFDSLIEYVREESGILGQMTFREFQRVAKLLQCRLEFKSTFERIAWKKLKSYQTYISRCLSRTQFQKYLKEEQFQSPQRAQLLTQRLFSSDSDISFYEFGQFLFGHDNDAYDQSLEDCLMDESRPLNQYFCLSSHNTYLTGNQLTSDSRAQRYTEDLQNGFRCVQIDVHNGSDGNPIVKHGFTMTAAVTLQKVLAAIAAFTRKHQQHTPIILSIQSHLDLQQQKKTAILLHKHFPDKIYTIATGLQQQQFPSLKELRGRIIIKNKGTFQQYLSLAAGNITSSIQIGFDDVEEEQEAVHESTINMPAQQFECPPQFKNLMSDFVQIKNRLLEQKTAFLKHQPFVIATMRMGFKSQSTKVIKIHPDMLAITSMLGSGKIERHCPFQSLSLSQKVIIKYMKQNPKKLSEHTANSWVRSYPAAGRMDSSNYNPIMAMQLGVQIIALNSQYPDHNILILRNFLRRSSKQVPGYRIKKMQQSQTLSVRIRPISGTMLSQLDGSDGIPQVRVDMSFQGSKKDIQTNRKHSYMQAYTQTIRDNAYNPVFQSPRTMQLQIVRPQLGFLLLQVPRCGRNVVALQGLRKGYRVVVLLDDALRETNGRLMLKID